MENVREYKFNLMAERIYIMIDGIDQLHGDLNKLYQVSENIEGIEAIESLADVPNDLLTARDLAAKLINQLIFVNNDIIRGTKKLKEQ